MAEFLSEHYTATAGGSTIDDPRLKVAAGLGHSKLHYKRGEVLAPAAITTGDVLRFFSMKTSDRLSKLIISTEAGFTGTGQPADCGFYQTDLGVVVDSDAIIAGGVAPLDDLTVGIDGVDLLGVDVSEWHAGLRGLPIWKAIDTVLGTALYDTDPHEVWDVCLTMGTENSVSAGGIIVLEAYYTTAGG